LCQTKEAAEVVLGIADGVRPFALAAEIVFDQAIESRKGLMVVLRSAVLGVGALEGLC
jgi:hypothetical protein